MRSGWGRRVVGILAAAAALLATVALARAQSGCQACGADMWCMASDRGAIVCIGTGDACLMGGRCGPRGPAPWYLPYGMIQLSVLESPDGLGPGLRARVLRDVGAISVGREAPRLALEALGRPGPEPGIVFSGVGSGDGATAVFRSRLGDGFAFRRDAEGRGARVTIRAVNGGRPGMLLARERLGERDVLAVRVTLEGRPRIVLVQAPTLEPAEAATLERTAREQLRGANGARPGVAEVPFEMVPGDD